MAGTSKNSEGRGGAVGTRLTWLTAHLHHLIHPMLISPLMTGGRGGGRVMERRER